MTKTQSVRQNQKIKFLRYILRRKQCATLALIEVALCVMLSSFCIGAYFGYQIFNDQRIEIDKENAIIDRYADNITFAHCKFIEVTDFNTQFCKNRIGVVAFAYRYHALENDNDKTCLDINEQIYCHESLIENKNLYNPNPLTTSKKYQNSCSGFSNSTLAKNNKNNETEIRMIPRYLYDENIENDVPEFINRSIVHVQELFIKCPKCIPDGAPKENGGKNCFQKIKTIEKGWPWFAENCKEGEITTADCSFSSSSTTTTKTPSDLSDSPGSSHVQLTTSATTTAMAVGRPQNMLNLIQEQQQIMSDMDDEF
uniref:Uncharacterized protein n=1 Tax=Panagrolaimus sp. ES5 TaxID=591445 RepID=A0AC34FVQ6_9BILA